ncbi:MAG: hypothetical protein Terrestrivirus1_196 [Terrestrivirus sp.]|uniref:Uncharacterized protein n=1 Tax=Terrestrivirus sp. TaxID=2487775 RepID=A0A3G4ZKF8_9VIRU|nr:MAG: hypothetical protein Terrestrivirus1_196 [Terrestrivirus sp.]
MVTYGDCLNSQKDFDNYVVQQEEMIKSTENITDKKEQRKQSTNLRTDLNKKTIEHESNLAQKIHASLLEMEKFKGTPLFDVQTVRNLYVLLATKGGRLCARYVKLPKEWVNIGIFAGILEDMVVVMRTPNQIGLGNKHMFSIDEIISGFRTYCGQEVKNNVPIRFLFLHRLVMDNAPNEINDILSKCIHSQGSSKRIGMYQEGGMNYYYAIQGLYGGIEFDKRVVTVITPEMFDNNVSSIPSALGLHFTRAEIASSIWNNEETTSQRLRSNGKPILRGNICRFDRPIHALTNIGQTDGKYHIVCDNSKDLRDRMTHGIKEASDDQPNQPNQPIRQKYESGLIIDIKKLVSTLPNGSVYINELGTMLVNDDIPHDCLLYHLSTDQDLEFFWNN